MRRAARPTLIALTALSLLLLAATLMCWVGAAMGDRVWLRFTRHSVILFGADGSYVAAAEGYFFDPAPRMNDATYEGPSGLLRLLRAGRLKTQATRFAGVEFYSDASGPTPRFRAVVVPTAYPVALLALSSAAGILLALRARRRVARGRCAKCNYDLTGNVSGVCPECGTRTRADASQEGLGHAVRAALWLATACMLAATVTGCRRPQTRSAPPTRPSAVEVTLEPQPDGLAVQVTRARAGVAELAQVDATTADGQHAHPLRDRLRQLRNADPNVTAIVIAPAETPYAAVQSSLVECANADIVSVRYATTDGTAAPVSTRLPFQPNGRGELEVLAEVLIDGLTDQDFLRVGDRAGVPRSAGAAELIELRGRIERSGKDVASGWLVLTPKTTTTWGTVLDALRLAREAGFASVALATAR